LVSRFGDKLIFGDAIGERYAVDWSAENPCLPALVLRASSVDDVAALLSYCCDQKLPVVTQGGMTGLSGGATPQPGEIALSLENLSAVTEVDRQAMTISALAGTPLQRLQQAAEEVDLRIPLDLGSRGSCTIGGNVATNSGGNQVLCYGMARSLVLGLEVVLADGRIIRSMKKMIKNNAGYDLKQLFIGSEGTLGVVTEVLLQLSPQAEYKHTALCAFDDFSALVDFLRRMQSRFSRVTAFEVMWRDYLDMVLTFNPRLREPFDRAYPLLALIEIESGETESTARFESCLADDMAAGMLCDVLIAQSSSDASAFWSLREGVSEILARAPLRANFDVGIAIGSMAEFIDEVGSCLQRTFDNLTFCVFGHIADGNLHLLCWTDNADDVDQIYRIVYRLVSQFDGSITAEHGVGALKRDYLSDCRSENEIDLMRILKQSLDPHGILNSGRVI